MKKDGSDGRQLTFDWHAGWTAYGPASVTGVRESNVQILYSSSTQPLGDDGDFASYCHSVPVQIAPSADVVPFVDATTIALRRNAVRRVELAGIFSVSTFSKP